MNLVPNRMRAARRRPEIPTPPNDPRIIAGYSRQMLESAIAELEAVRSPGAWERERLPFLREELSRRNTPVPRRATRPLDARACRDG